MIDPEKSICDLIGYVTLVCLHFPTNQIAICDAACFWRSIFFFFIGLNNFIIVFIFLYRVNYNEVIVANAEAVVNATTAAALSGPVDVAATELLPEALKADMDKTRSQTVTRLWQVTERMNILYPENWTRAASEEILAFQQQLTLALTRQLGCRPKAHVIIDDSPLMAEPQARAGIRWTFARGLLYSVSLLTTIGESNF